MSYSYYVCDCPDKTHAAGPCTGVWFSSATLAAHARRWLERAERAEAEVERLHSQRAALALTYADAQAERDRLRAALEEIVKTHGFDSVTCARRALAKP